MSLLPCDLALSEVSRVKSTFQRLQRKMSVYDSCTWSSAKLDTCSRHWFDRNCVCWKSHCSTRYFLDCVYIYMYIYIYMYMYMYMCIILYHIISYHIILYHIILYYITLYYIIYIILYYIVLYYTILYYIISYYIILYYIILYTVYKSYMNYK